MLTLAKFISMLRNITIQVNINFHSLKHYNIQLKKHPSKLQGI